MTTGNRQRLEVAVLSLLFGAGAGWGAFEIRLAQLSVKVDRIDERVTAMYCSTIPEPQRAACR